MSGRFQKIAFYKLNGRFEACFLSSSDAPIVQGSVAHVVEQCVKTFERFASSSPMFDASFSLESMVTKTLNLTEEQEIKKALLPKGS